MNPMIMSLWLSLLLGSGSLYAVGPSTADPLTPDHDPAQEDRHGEPHASGHGTEGQAHDDDRERKDDGHGHSDEQGHAEGEPGMLYLTPDQLKTLDVRTERLEPRALGETLRAPGEVRLNAYASAQVAPRIVAQVTERHARLGDKVEAGQPMVTLSSVEMAEAQGKLVVAERAWQRVRALGRKVVAESRYLEAQIGRQQARARVIAFGMTAGQVDELLRAGAAKADGTFVLLAPQAGRVIADNFMLGEVIGAGRTLFKITDESVRWVEARMSPEDVARVSVGDPARVSTGTVRLDGRVTQIHHQLDETTRTQAIRVEVPDPGHRLHPGVFVDVKLYTGQGAPVLALPEAAVAAGPRWGLAGVRGRGRGRLLHARGSHPDTHHRWPGGNRGLGPRLRGGDSGAFFLQSELAKGGFDIHQH